MAKELEIFINADATKAIKGMEGFSDSLSKMRKDLVSSSSSLDGLDSSSAEYSAALAEVENQTQRYLSALDKTLAINEQSGKSVSTLSRNYRLLGKELAVLQYGLGNQDSAVLSGMKERMTAYYDALSQLQEESLRPNKAAIEKSFMELVGDEKGLGTLKLQEYENALKSVIATEGAGSEAAKKLAEQYKKQEVSLDALSASTSKAPSFWKSLTASFISAQAAIGLVHKGVSLTIELFREAASAAAEAEETANLFNTTYGNISVTANNLASSMASTLGMAETSAQQILGMFGDLAMGYGQTQTAALEFAKSATQTGLDIISFKNIAGDTTDIMSAMASAIVGNFENLRQWGIIVTMTEVNARLAAKGYDKLTGSALQFAKMQETLAIVQEKSSNAHGDMAKTLDSTANLTRRVSEANKELLSNIGGGINTVLNPLKKAWLDIVDSINKANRAQEQYEKGQKNIGVYDIRNNKEDRKDFYSDIRGAGGVSKGVSMTPYITNEGKFIESMNEIMRIYEASATDVFKALHAYGIEYTKDIADQIIAISDLAEHERQEEKSLEKRRSALEDATSAAETYLDTLMAIKGVEINTGFDAYHHEGNIEYFISSDSNLEKAGQDIAAKVRQAVGEAISSLSSISWEDFLSPIDVALGESTEMDGLEKKLEAVYTLYEEISNYSITQGIDATETLTEVAGIYKEISDSMEAISNEEERRKDILKEIESMRSDLGDVAKDTAQLDMTDREKALDDIQRRYAESLKMLNKESENYTDELNILTTVMGKQIRATNEYYEALEEKEHLEEFNEALEDSKNALEDWRLKLLGATTNEREEALAKINQEEQKDLASAATEDERKQITDIYDSQRKAANEYYDESIEKEFSSFLNSFKAGKTYTTDAFSANNKVAQDAYNEAMNEGIKEWEEVRKQMEDYGATSEDVASKWKMAAEHIESSALEAAESANKAAEKEGWDNLGGNALSSLGEIGELANAFMNLGSAAGMSGLLGILVSLASQLEIVSEVSSLLSDSILPVLDAFLSPLIPVLESIMEIIGTVLYAVLNPFYQLMISIGEILNTVLGLLQPVLTLLMEISNVIGDFLYPIFQALSLLFQAFMEPLMGLFQIISDILMPILAPFIAILQTFATALVYVYASFSVAVHFVIDSLKYLAGWVMRGVSAFVNGILDIIDKIPFVDIGWRMDDTKYKEWTSALPWERSQGYWDEAIGLLDDINKSNMEISSNTSEKADISDLEKVYSRGLISGSEFEALVAEKLGTDYRYADDIVSSSAQYVQNQNLDQNISYGNVTITISGYSGNAKELAKEVKRILEKGAANPTFDMAV